MAQGDLVAEGVNGAAAPVTPGTAGDVLTSNGAGALPTYQPSSGGGGGAPTTAHYVTTQAEAGLSAETSLGALPSGLLKHTVAAGVSTPATAAAGTDYVAPGAVTTSGLTQSSARLLGRTTAGTGAVEEITVGSGLSLTAGSLSAIGGGGAWVPAVDGSEPPTFLTDGAGVLLLVAA